LFYSSKDFKLQFLSTHVILDGTGTPIKKPFKSVEQRSTFSMYKIRNTVKVLISAGQQVALYHTFHLQLAARFQTDRLWNVKTCLLNKC